MKYAQKIALDLDREYRPVHRPSVPVKKGALSLDIKRILNKKKDDQEKVKDYINALHRYVNIRDTIPHKQETELQINLLNEPITPTTPPPPPTCAQKKKQRRKKKRVTATREWAQRV